MIGNGLSLHCALIVSELLSLTILPQSAVCQDVAERWSPANRVSVRISSATVAEFQYSRLLFPFLSGDVVFQTSTVGPSVGFTVLPVDFLFAQARVGLPLFEESAAPDGPMPFKPDYMVMLRGGFLWRIKDSPIVLEFAAGKVLLVQRRYSTAGGGLLLADVPNGVGVRF